MKLSLLLFTLCFSLYAGASTCFVSASESRKLLKKLSSADKILLSPSTEMKCSDFRMERDYIQMDRFNRYLEGHCENKWQRLDIEKVYVAAGSQNYSKLDSENFCGKKAEPISLFDKLKPSCSLKDGISSDCYFPRQKAVLRAALVYYGAYWQQADLERFKNVFASQFAKATRGELEIEVVKIQVIPFMHPLPPSYAYNGITDPERLQRIWYWENVGTGVGGEIYKVFEQKQEDLDELKDIDLLLAITGAQSEGNGFAAGRVVVIEQPREVAWGAKNQGFTEELSDYEAADILTHEVGHAIGIGHASEHCTETGLPLEKRLECCKLSPSGNDVMSYCRDRKAVDENRVNYFEGCTLDIIKSKIKPRLLSGGKRRIEEEIHCR